MVATRRRKSGEKSEDAKEKNGANGTKNGKASKGRSSGGLVAAAAVAVLAVGSRWRALRGLSDSGYGAKPSS